MTATAGNNMTFFMAAGGSASGVMNLYMRTSATQSPLTGSMNIYLQSDRECSWETAGPQPWEQHSAHWNVWGCQEAQGLSSGSITVTISGAATGTCTGNMPLYMANSQVLATGEITAFTLGNALASGIMPLHLPGNPVPTGTMTIFTLGTALTAPSGITNGSITATISGGTPSFSGNMPMFLQTVTSRTITAERTLFTTSFNDLNSSIDLFLGNVATTGFLTMHMRGHWTLFANPFSQVLNVRNYTTSDDVRIIAGGGASTQSAYHVERDDVVDSNFPPDKVITPLPGGQGLYAFNSTKNLVWGLFAINGAIPASGFATLYLPGAAAAEANPATGTITAFMNGPLLSSGSITATISGSATGSAVPGEITIYMPRSSGVATGTLPIITLGY
jgi:hypothetical protein